MSTVFSKMNDALIRMEIKRNKYLERLLNEEEGASNIVATLVLIVIVIGVAAVFQEQLQNLIEAAFKKATEFFK